MINTICKESINWSQTPTISSGHQRWIRTPTDQPHPESRIRFVNVGAFWCQLQWWTGDDICGLKNTSLNYIVYMKYVCSCDSQKQFIPWYMLRSANTNIVYDNNMVCIQADVRFETDVAEFVDNIELFNRLSVTTDVDINDVAIDASRAGDVHDPDTDSW